MKYRIPAPGTEVEIGRCLCRIPVRGTVVDVRTAGHVQGLFIWATVRPRGLLRFARRVPAGWVRAIDADAPHIEIDIPA